MSRALFGGRFEIETLLGSGGMARVHRARDTRLGRIVAVKTLLPELARDPKARHRFAREARAAAALNHPGIVIVHDQDEADGEDGIVPYLVMEYIDGGTLEGILQQETSLEVERAVRVTCAVLDALAHAHSRGTVHRDVKPANVMITKTGVVKVADFGIARVVDAVTRLTGTGLAVGTPGYMSPEQVLGKPVDARGDVYAVGCLLTELLTGSVPFTGSTPLNLMYGHVHGTAPLPSQRNPEVPPELDAIVLKALAKNPAERPRDAGAMRDALHAWLEERGTRRSGEASGGDAHGAAPGTGAAVVGAANPDEPVPARYGDGAATQRPAPQGRGSGALPAESGTSSVTGEAAGNGASGGDRAAGGEGADLNSCPSDGKGHAAEGGATGEGTVGGGKAGDETSGSHTTASTDPRTGFSLVKDIAQAAPAAPPQPPTGAPGFPPPGPGYAYPPLGGTFDQPPTHPHRPFNPYAQPSLGSGHPSGSGHGTAGQPAPLAVPSTPAPVSGGARSRRPLLIAALAAVTVGILVAVPLLNGMFGGDGGRGGKQRDVYDLRKETRGFNGALTGAVNPSRKKGGTLKLASSYPPDSLDPARSYTVMAWNLQRLYLRKLVDYAPAPGDAGRRLVGDLATDTGKATDGGKTYTFTLRKGVTFEDGSPITSKDVKYGIERTFASEYDTGPKHLVDLLDQGQNYRGPYEDSHPAKLGLRSVSTPNDRAIVFRLKDPFPDFPYVLAMSIASPVPKDKDDRASYQRRPVASGPYRIASQFDAQSSASLRLVRNAKWAPSTDPLRTALPDRIELTLMKDQREVDEAVLDGRVDFDAGQSGVEEDTLEKIRNDDELRDRADVPYSGGVRYLSLQTMVEPFDDFHCRRAVQYAVDKPAVRAAFGGPDRAGDIASVMLPPTIAGYDRRADAYRTRRGPQPGEAKRELRECGEENGFEVKVVAPAGPPAHPEVLEAVADSLEDVGIDAEVELVTSADYYQTLYDRDELKKKRWGIALTAWASDWPAPAGFLRPLITKDSDHNYAGLDDWVITDLVGEAGREKDPREVEDIWENVDDKLMGQSVVVPLLHTRHLTYRGPRLTNAYIHPALGSIDLQALGVTDHG